MNSYPWQQKQWRQLAKQCQQHKLPHALLLTGAEGLGKFEFAKNLAQLILCESPLHDEPCEVCKSCHLFKTQNHPDFFLIQPEENSRNIKVDQVRALTTDLTQTSKHSSHQLVLMNPANSMNTSSANSLLKTLEEPLGHVIFLLVTSHPERLPLTILSRCQRVNFYADETEATLGWLSQHISLNEHSEPRSQQNRNSKGEGYITQAELLLRIAHGSPLKAVQLQQEDYLQKRYEFLKSLNLLLIKQTSVLSIAQAFVKLQSEDILDYFYTWCLDLFKLQLGAKPQFFVYTDKMSELQVCAQKINADSLKEFLLYLLKARSLQSSDLHLNPQLFFEDLLLHWKGLFDKGNKGSHFWI